MNGVEGIKRYYKNIDIKIQRIFKLKRICINVKNVKKEGEKDIGE